ncbi:class I SAM-dependent methyltransferase [Agitococcus lubricus]|uniref:Methyltransferase family protein n=1 Tax=Agitococcus lubricus TaxID=1077255 RepID=A0A2T5IVP5_9GAMM|nr:class I SAM-dependent methyltransferase [Agitococcus lubricus]PTQ87891.1 methyltransferase family protein [Agitococcus lubricus]
MTKKFIHIGCGKKNKYGTASGFANEAWHEVRVDISAACKPDIQADMLDMHMIQSGAVDALFSSHNLEHVFPHQVPTALAEFKRVLNHEGFMVVGCPDLEAICQHILDGKLMEPMFETSSGRIAPIDIIYGWREALAKGEHYMAHKCGFTMDSLIAQVRAVGFNSIIGKRRGGKYDVWILASNKKCTSDELKQLAEQYIP